MADDLDATILYTLRQLQDTALSEPFFSADDIAARSNLARWAVAAHFTRLAVDGYVHTDPSGAATPLYRLAPRGNVRLNRTHLVREGEPPLEGLSRPETNVGLWTMQQRVLVVDDDPILRNLVSEILTQEDYDVEVVSDGAQALEAVDRNPPAVMLLDMRMPVLDGWTVAQRLREHGYRVPTVVMTGVEDARECCAEVQADAYLGKPFVLDDLLSAVAQALHQ
jgi:CheY-like chemotaxis protein